VKSQSFLIPFVLIVLGFFALNAFSDTKKPFRTFITLKSYHIAQSGNSLPEHNIQLKLKLEGQEALPLPQKDLSWTIANGGTQTINQTFEIPFEALQSDSFSFELQMIRKGKKIDPCRFTVSHVSQYNRSYVCRSDVNHQLHKQNLPLEKISKEAVEIRVFTSLKTKKKEIPRQVIALK